jgi:hypothetical protein
MHILPCWQSGRERKRIIASSTYHNRPILKIKTLMVRTHCPLMLLFGLQRPRCGIHIDCNFSYYCYPSLGMFLRANATTTTGKKRCKTEIGSYKDARFSITLESSFSVTHISYNHIIKSVARFTSICFFLFFLLLEKS